MAEVASTGLVGRTDVLDELGALLRLAGDGAPCLVLLTGETGVGKTRLLREVVARYEPTLLAGACVPMAGEPLPYAPLRQGLRRLRGHGVVRQELTRSAALARLVTGVADAEEAERASQAALFQAVLSLIDRLGASAPVLHLVEDLHWADRSTLDLLRYLAVNMSTERVLVVGTYRDDAVTPGSALAGWAAEVGRLDITRRIGLDRLDAEETARLVASLTGGHPDPTLLDSTLSRSAGNPLFIEQLVLRGAGEDLALPVTLQELLAARVDALPEGSRSLLSALAVHGRSVPLERLADTLHVGVEDAEQALRPALEQHVLELRDEQRVGFRHPAFEEVVYGGLLPTERTRLHLAAASALERSRAGVASPEPADVRAAELARHWLRSGEEERALDAAVEAGRTAECVYAFADAQVWFGRAAELAQRWPSDHDPMRLLSRAAEAAALTGDTREAERLGEAALALAAEPAQQAELCERLGTYAYLAGSGPRAEHWFRQARAALPEGEVSVLAARVHAGLALLAGAWSRLEEAQEWGEDGLRLARATGARREEGRLQSALGLAAAARGRTDDGVAHQREALAIAEEVGEPHDIGTAYVNLSHVLGLAGRWDEVVDVGRAGMAAVARVGLSAQRGNLLRANTGEALITLGRLDEAQALLDDPQARRVRGIMAAPGLMQSARIAVLRGDLRAAWDQCGRARAVVEAEGAPDAWLRDVHELTALIELWAGRPAAAYDAVIDGLDLIAGGDEEGFGDELAALGMRALADQAEAHRDRGSQRALDRRVAPLLDAMDRIGARPESAAYAAWFAAEHARFSHRSDPALWDTAVAAWDAVGQPLRALYARWRAAEARLDTGVDGAAIAALRAAYDGAVRLGMVRVSEELVRLAAWHRIDLPAADEAPAVGGTPSTGVAAPDADGTPAGLRRYGLTERELEVLAGLAEGRTNREIGEELFISTKTASVHVSNILRKLDVSGRQEAARVAYRLGVRGVEAARESPPGDR
ncbi:helix-turn-helix transcriptional regulator [Luteipulveratus flavus]|uniref:AAA family ATPase n=1 Tax=Luteipulveratus flavus TaxID=3031728 RepID=A0ABT6CB58_9MICO|nr:LuxR family transcriptional regulator [Luteipulveratus sp. YIM 133296]MDF8266130.1 AAA family ATPase [Luteipulveratus sp. YIM 133296]